MPIVMWIRSSVFLALLSHDIINAGNTDTAVAMTNGKEPVQGFEGPEDVFVPDRVTILSKFVPVK
jgi:hypothetical protein